MLNRESYNFSSKPSNTSNSHSHKKIQNGYNGVTSNVSQHRRFSDDDDTRETVIYDVNKVQNNTSATTGNFALLCMVQISFYNICFYYT